MRDTFYPPLILGLHDEMCFIAQWAEDAMFIIPRNHLKTTILTVYYNLWRIAKNPNIRIFVGSDTLDSSKAFISSIQGCVESNRKLRALFPHLRPQMIRNTTREKKWSEKALLFKRDRKQLKEPTITATSGKLPKTGFHFDIMDYDDIITPDNVTNQEQIEKRIEWYQMTAALQDRGAVERIKGTPYNDADLYSKMIKNNEIPYYHRSYIENGKWIWDTPDNRKYVQKNRARMTPYMFNCQFMCDPVPEGDEQFPSGWFQEWDWKFIKNAVNIESNDPDTVFTRWIATHDRYVGIDLNRAREVKKENDYMVVMAAGVDIEGRVFVYDFKREKPTTPIQRIEMAMKMIKKYNPKKVGIEVFGGDENLVQPLRIEMQKNGIPAFRLKRFDVTPHMDNADYILETQLDFELKRIWFGSDNKFDEMKSEFMRVGIAEHDDIAVTFSKILKQLIRDKKPDRILPKEEPKGYMQRLQLAGTDSENNWLRV